eukprot:gene7403-7467_t
MNDLVQIVLPVFGLIVIGYGAGLLGLFSQRTGAGLSEYVFTLGIPLLIFKTLINATLPESQPWGYWLSYFGGVALVWLLAMLVTAKFFGLTYRESVIAGFSSGQSNTVLVGIPLLLKAYGEPGAVPLFLLIAVHLPVTMTAATLLFEGASFRTALALLPKLLLHPILFGLVLGVLFRLSGANLPVFAHTIIDSIAASALPCALIAMGLSLRHHGMNGSLGLSCAIGVLKLMVHPALVYVLAFKIFTLPPVWAGVAVLFAASPTGVNCYLFAAKYQTGEKIASSAIALTTALSLFTTLFWLCLGYALAATLPVALAGALGARATIPNIPVWYQGLAKPPLTPPNWVFGPAWTILYILMAYAFYRILRHSPREDQRNQAILVFISQLILNALWSFAFFAAHSPALGLCVILPLELLIGLTILRFAALDRLAASCLLPYAGWVAFAIWLNAGVWWLAR